MNSKHIDRTYHHPPSFNVANLPITKNEDYRIVFLGDSFTQGYRLRSNKETIPNFVKTILERDYQLSVESINLGTTSYSPIIEYLIARKIAINLKPDLMILMVDESDAQDDAIYERMAVIKDGEIEAVDPYKSAYRKWYYHSIVVRKLLYSISVFKGESPLDFANHIFIYSKKDNSQKELCVTEKIFCQGRRYSYSHHDKPLSHYMPHYDRTLNYINKIASLCDRNDIPLLVVSYPYPAAIDLTEHSIHWRKHWSYPLSINMKSRFIPYLTEYLKIKKIKHYDFTDFVLQYEDVAKLYPGDHSHYNGFGNEIFASRLAEQIIDIKNN